MLIEDVGRLGVWERCEYFIRERDKVRVLKEARTPKPWTNDVIIQSNSFCNIRRMDDRVSDWFYRTWYRPYKNHPAVAAACCLARWVNNPASLNGVTTPMFSPGSPNWAEIEDHLHEHYGSVGPVFSGAYMVRGYPGEPKIITVVRQARDIHESDFTPDTSSMEKTHAALCPFPGVGPFIAGQIVADMRWAMTGTWKDKHDWAPPGPGSKRGIKRLLSPTDDYRDAPVHDWHEEFQKYLTWANETFPGSITSRMEAIDWQNTLCETDKYLRVLNGQGRAKRRYPGRA